ncbi:hypothetical protein PN466_08030 [Roseofilum reptotaenium CS-1145]|uniref:Uncharacterized protein n=1 Tax=Roseofilum reptotaenium AO1-A TaxID=1925591 RepID=A0A1L9QKK7_9CYAN|nr:hypothetical protein [Roseofilum reptotaenium]MDB9516893.1 hypothetical protein [Roseofilum reptotaenium CS-1145]OJJ16508.1 hypothetical protein BI308_23595 [Roseofilum reptotaenium AO1-A]
MPIVPIVWVIAGAFAAGAGVGAVVAVFWDEIKAWASRVLGYILDAINYVIEVTSDAITYIAKEGARVYKRVVVYVRNIRTGGTRKEIREEEIVEEDLPYDIQSQLEYKANIQIEILRQAT